MRSRPPTPILPDTAWDPGQAKCQVRRSPHASKGGSDGAREQSAFRKRRRRNSPVMSSWIDLDLLTVKKLRRYVVYTQKQFGIGSAPAPLPSLPFAATSRI
jgi:hypothetical protein